MTRYMEGYIEGYITLVEAYKENEVKDILNVRLYHNNSICGGGINWDTTDGKEFIQIGDYFFTVQELEALTWWVRNKSNG